MAYYTSTDTANTTTTTDSVPEPSNSHRRDAGLHTGRTTPKYGQLSPKQTTPLHVNFRPCEETCLNEKITSLRSFLELKDPRNDPYNKIPITPSRKIDIQRATIATVG